MINASDPIEFQDQRLQQNVLYDNSKEKSATSGGRVREVTPPARSNKFDYAQQSDAKTDGRLPVVGLQPNNLRYGFDSADKDNMPNLSNIAGNEN